MAKRGTGTLRKIGVTVLISVPAVLRNDDEFKFKEGQELDLRLETDPESKGKTMLTVRADE